LEKRELADQLMPSAFRFLECGDSSPLSSRTAVLRGSSGRSAKSGDESPHSKRRTDWQSTWQQVCRMVGRNIRLPGQLHGMS
jgi:hypothetical protein